MFTKGKFIRFFISSMSKQDIGSNATSLSLLMVGKPAALDSSVTSSIIIKVSLTAGQLHQMLSAGS